MLVDKSYYDYDYTEPKKKVVIKLRSAEEINNLMNKFGFGKDKPNIVREEQDSVDDLQKSLINELKPKKNNG